MTNRPVPMALKIAAVPIVIVVLAVGVWIAGGVISDDMNVAMLLTAIWFAVAGLVALLVVRARRDLRVPVLGTFIAAAAVIGIYLGYNSLVDDEVNERVAVGAPAAQARPGGNVQLLLGEFQSGAHDTTGTAAVVELAEGGRVLTLTDFETDPGPDLRVYLATDRSADDNVDLEGLKGNVGNQQYEIPGDVDLAKYSTVVIWCRAFSVEFGSAELRGS